MKSLSFVVYALLHWGDTGFEALAGVYETRKEAQESRDRFLADKKYFRVRRATLTLFDK